MMKHETPTPTPAELAAGRLLSGTRTVAALLRGRSDPALVAMAGSLTRLADEADSALRHARRLARYSRP